MWPSQRMIEGPKWHFQTYQVNWTSIECQKSNSTIVKLPFSPLFPKSFLIAQIRLDCQSTLKCIKSMKLFANQWASVIYLEDYFNVSNFRICKHRKERMKTYSSYYTFSCRPVFYKHISKRTFFMHPLNNKGTYFLLALRFLYKSSLPECS